MRSADFLQAGSFNVRLAIETPVATPDGCGGTENAWQQVANVWVRIVPVKGIVVHHAENEGVVVSHWIFLRHRSDITREMRFISQAGIQGRVFEIDAILDPDETGRYLQCNVREVE